MRNSGVHAVVVTYLPEPKTLSELLAALIPQVQAVFIIDNTPGNNSTVSRLVDTLDPSCVELVQLRENVGIARALNVGIERAVKAGATHVLLSDQDSVPAADMVEQLLGVTQRLEAEGQLVACVGAAFHSLSGGIHRFQVQGNGRFYTTCAGDQAIPWVEVISTITSGSLIPASVFEDVGLMREDYFIDFVDTEWCLRARNKGYTIYGTSLAQMEHRVGDKVFQAWYGNWRSFSGYSPTRLYYQYRNGISLLRSSVVPLAWKIRMGWTWLGNIPAYIFFAPKRLRNLKAIIRGLCDGLRGHGGPLAGVVADDITGVVGERKINPGLGDEN